MLLTTTSDQKTAPTMRVPSAIVLRIEICREGVEMFSQIQSTAGAVPCGEESGDVVRVNEAIRGIEKAT